MWGWGGRWEGQMLQLCRKFSLSVGCADFRSLSFMQESGQSQANAPVYQQNGESAPAFGLWEQHFPRSLCSAAGGCTEAFIAPGGRELGHCTGGI
jgi:hypothetical protein